MDVRKCLRRRELSGWRTPILRSDFNYSNFLFTPALKLRGLPYTCTNESILEWFGEYGSFVKKIIILKENNTHNTGFALVLMTDSESTQTVWKNLHRKKFGPRRFIEIFCIVPPNCPIDSNYCDTDGSYSDNCCRFCANPIALHSDKGLQSINSILALKSGAPLMNVKYLHIPALIYSDNKYIQDLSYFQPELKQSQLSYIMTYPSRVVNLVHVCGSVFFDFLDLEDYHMSDLLGEINESLKFEGSLTLGELGSLISIKGRAYLFVTECKLQNIFERFSYFYKLNLTERGLSLELQPDKEDLNFIKFSEVYPKGWYSLSKKRSSSTNSDKNVKKTKPVITKSGVQHAAASTSLPQLCDLVSQFSDVSYFKSSSDSSSVSTLLNSPINELATLPFPSNLKFNEHLCLDSTELKRSDYDYLSTTIQSPESSIDSQLTIVLNEILNEVNLQNYAYCDWQ